MPQGKTQSMFGRVVLLATVATMLEITTAIEHSPGFCQGKGFTIWVFLHLAR
jgi:hypothetical protein